MEEFIIIQILGIATLIIFVISLQQREKNKFLIWQTIGTLIFVAQYILSDKITGAITFAVVAVRGLVFYIYSKMSMKPSSAVLIAFLVILSVSTYFTWQNLWSVIPLTATISKTWGTWQDDMKRTRKASLFGQILMIVYNLSAAMYTGALTEVCNAVSSVVAMRRFDYRKNKV